MPAAAVITAPLVVVTFIGPKASVAGLICLWLNPAENCRSAGDTVRLGAGRGQGYITGKGKIF